MQGPSSHTSQRTVLVLGARGTVGSDVTRALLEAGARVRILTRSSSGLDHLPDTVERLVGDVRDSACLAGAMEGVASAFYSSPHEEDEEQLARNVVEACETAGARLVFIQGWTTQAGHTYGVNITAPGLANPIRYTVQPVNCP